MSERRLQSAEDRAEIAARRRRRQRLAAGLPAERTWEERRDAARRFGVAQERARAALLAWAASLRASQADREDHP